MVSLQPFEFWMSFFQKILHEIFPNVNVRILRVILPNIGILRLSLHYWNSGLILSIIGILTLCFQTLELSHYSSKHWNSDLILPNTGILASCFQTIIRMLIFTWTNFGIVTLSFQLILTLSLQTLELWPYLFKYWNSDLFLPKLWPDPFKHWNATLSFRTLEYSKHCTAEDPTAFIY